MKLVLVRHGRPDEADTQRPHDPPLREDGRRQASAVAAVLAQQGITRIVASPLLRAQQTAAPLADALGLPVHTIDGWAEADRHLPRYSSTETLRARGDAEWARFLDDPIGYLGGDPVRFRADVRAAFEATLDGPDDEHVAVFTHGLPINLVLSTLLGLERIIHFPPDYGSLTRLRARGGRVGIVSVNETAHQLPFLQPALLRDTTT